jgi:hypothetical protein
MRVLRPIWVISIALAVVGWWLLTCFIAWQYLPPSTATVVPGTINVTLGALLAYCLGLRTYFKRREHEIIQRRYVDDGVDRARDHIQSMTRVIYENGAEAARTLAMLRAGQLLVSDATFKQVSPDFSVLGALFRLNTLIGDDIFGEWVRDLTSDAKATASLFAEKIGVEVPVIVKDHGPKARLALIDRLDQFTRDYQDQPEKATAPVAALEFLASILDKDTSLNWHNLDNFKDRADVKDMIATLRAKLQEYRQSHFTRTWQERVAGPG